jgi:hypothetical protein
MQFACHAISCLQSEVRFGLGPLEGKDGEDRFGNQPDKNHVRLLRLTI